MGPPCTRIARRSRTFCGLLAAAVALTSLLQACSSSQSRDPPTSGGGSGAPELFLDAEFTSALRATRAVVDAGTIWLVDDHGDLVYGTDPSLHWGQERGLSLSWPQVQGAAKYHVLARNKDIAPTDWKELATVAAPDPRLAPTVVATGLNPWTAGIGTGGFPWSFGNHVEFAVSAEDSAGTTVSNGLSALLETSDGFPGLVTEIEIDRDGLPQPFTSAVERGVTFTKTFRVSFSEPMRTDATPTLTVQNARLMVSRVVHTGWGAAPDAPSSIPTSAASHAFIAIELRARGTCTEQLLAREPGDVILQVRDTALFQAGLEGRLLLVRGDDGSRIGEAGPVSTVDGGSGLLTLGAPLVSSLGAGDLVCVVAGGPALPTPLVSASGARIQVEDASGFFLGETIAVYEPPPASSPVYDLRTITGLDTTTDEIVLSTALSSGHGTSSLVVQLGAIGGEVRLRPSVVLDLVRDAVGGPGTELFVAATAAVMAGDTVLVDADGDLGTTPDQWQAVVKAVRFAPPPGTPPSLVLDLPEGAILLHGQAKVTGIGDAFQVGGTRDTSALAVTPLDPHADQFSPDGLRF